MLMMLAQLGWIGGLDDNSALLMLVMLPQLFWIWGLRDRSALLLLMMLARCWLGLFGLVACVTAQPC